MGLSWPSYNINVVIFKPLGCYSVGMFVATSLLKHPSSASSTFQYFPPLSHLIFYNIYGPLSLCKHSYSMLPCIGPSIWPNLVNLTLSDYITLLQSSTICHDFSLSYVLLVISLTSLTYYLRSVLSDWTITHHGYILCLLIFFYLVLLDSICLHICLPIILVLLYKYQLVLYISFSLFLL